MKCVFFAMMAAGIFLTAAGHVSGQPVLSQPVSGQSVSGPQEQPVVLVKQEDCGHFTRHVPEADVAYRPGVDVRGGTVAPADLDGGWLGDFSPDIAFHLVLDTAVGRKGSLYARHPGLEQKMVLGYVEIRDGVAIFNGKPIEDRYYGAIRRLCAGEGAQKPTDKPKR